MDGVGARTVGGATLTGRWSRIGGVLRDCASISRSRSIMLEICAAIGSTITSTPLVTKSALVIEFSQSQHHPMPAEIGHSQSETSHWAETGKRPKGGTPELW